ncbi:MAG: hypothetical protein N4A72_01975 [Bacteroidales bacterium]|jgi:hypothetical protein|nr:hypothetical protein [Bacteroidales bacterium]
MRNIISVLSVVILFVTLCSCEKNEELKKKIVGEWDWKITYGGSVSYTPDNTGKIKKFIFDDDYGFKFVENGTTIQNTDYYFRTEESAITGSTKDLLIINFRSSSGKSIIPMRYTYRFEGNTMYLTEENFDGYIHKYEK